MRKYIGYLILAVVSTHVTAEVIDPEIHVQKNGFQSDKIGDDGRTRFFTFTERGSSARIAALESEIKALPKHVDVHKICDFMRGSTKARLIQQRGIAVDVAVTNYGYSGATVACVLKYMHGKSIGTQLIYSKKGAAGMYLVFVTD